MLLKSWAISLIITRKTSSYHHRFHRRHCHGYTLKMWKNQNTKSYVDVHAHLTHEKFHGEEDSILEKCNNGGLEYIICNGLEPISNRQVLILAEKYPTVLPALGIYPLDAACHVIIKGENWNNEFDPPEKFDIEAEVQFIDDMATQKKIVAVGECGLDKHYLKDEVSMKEQERVLRMLMKVS